MRGPRPLFDSPGVSKPGLDTGAGLRLGIALSALGLTAVNLSAEANRIAGPQFVLLLYVVYSTVLFGLSRVTSRDTAEGLGPWPDILWCIAIIGLSRGGGSGLFLLFLFPIISSSFSRGFWAGLRVTFSCCVLFILTTYFASGAAASDVKPLLLRSACLLGLGCAIARWGGLELKLKRRLLLLNDIPAVYNPRLGSDETVTLLLQRLGDFYGADDCLALIVDQISGESRLYRSRGPGVSRQGSGVRSTAELIDKRLANQLQSIPDKLAVVYRDTARNRDYCAYDGSERQSTPEGRAASERIGTLLGLGSFISVPITCHGLTLGRAFIGWNGRKRLDRDEAGFVAQVFEDAMPVIQNLQLVDRLTMQAAEEERRRIAGSIHDAIIQPHAGMLIAVAAATERIRAISKDGHGKEAGVDSLETTARELEKLAEMASSGIDDLRRYVNGLKSGEQGGSSLPASIRRFASEFSEATGISVSVQADDHIPGGDRLAAELFHMVAEGLSNIRRHTRAERAEVELLHGNDSLTLRIKNDGAADRRPVSFTPQSISDRARALGGRVRVELDGGEQTAVVVQVPL